MLLVYILTLKSLFKYIIGVHEMLVECTPIFRSRLLTHDPLSSLAHPTIIHTPPLVASNLSTKILVARQQPPKMIIIMCITVRMSSFMSFSHVSPGMKV